MCIRDRSTTDQMIDNGADVVHCYSNEGQSGAVQSCQDKGVKFVAFAGNKNGEADCVIASAYADLTKLYPWAVNALLVEGVRGYTEVAVSYTHLDVYKRQQLFWVII